ncbi:MAG TPA: cytosine permease [Candidatus Dormibacteraeota bacterium]
MSVATEDIEGLVPVREGDYGERVARVEPGGIEFIPLHERHGVPWRMFATWLSPNLEFATVFIGILGVAIFGLSFGQTALAIILGTALGSLTHGILSSWGPKFGVPMMVQSRGAFGFLGNILPAGLNAFTGAVGWFIVNSVSGAFAIQALSDGRVSFALAFAIVVVAQVAIATFGHNLIHAFEAVALPLLGIVFLVACVYIFSHTSFGFAANAKTESFVGGATGAFTLMFTAAFGYAAGWNPYAADYTRYFPPTASRQAIGWWSALGVLVSCVVLELAGAGVATVAGTKWGPTDIPTAQLALAMPDVVFKLTLLCIAIGAVAANVINIYSGVMSFLALGVREMGMTLRQRRAALAVVAGIIGLVIGIIGQANLGPGQKYEQFLLLISYWIAAWEGVIFTDYLLTRGKYDERHFFDTRWNRWQGFTAMFIALAVAIPLFANDYPLYVGKVPTASPGLGDITFIVAFVISAGLYLVFSLGRRAPVAEDQTAAA